MKASQQGGVFQLRSSLTSPNTASKVCSEFRNKSITYLWQTAKKSRKSWYCLNFMGSLWSTTHKKTFHPWHLMFGLIAHGFWEKFCSVMYISMLFSSETEFCLYFILETFNKLVYVLINLYPIMSNFFL